MRRIVVATLLSCSFAAWAAPSSAAPAPAAAPALKTQQANQCQEISSLAQAIMAARQKGIPMPQVLETLKQSGAGNLYTPMQAIAQDAYSRPQPVTELDRQKAVQDFGNEAFASCTKAQQQQQAQSKPKR